MLKKLLIIEDERDICMLLEQRAKKYHQLECEMDHTGDRCMDLALDFQPNVILLDLSLPSVTGFDLLKLLKGHEATKDIPVIVFSAHNKMEVVEAAMNLGAASFYSKANSMQNLFETVMNYAV